MTQINTNDTCPGTWIWWVVERNYEKKVETNVRLLKCLSPFLFVFLSPSVQMAKIAFVTIYMCVCVSIFLVHRSSILVCLLSNHKRAPKKHNGTITNKLNLAIEYITSEQLARVDNWPSNSRSSWLHSKMLVHCLEKHWPCTKMSSGPGLIMWEEGAKWVT